MGTDRLDPQAATVGGKYRMGRCIGRGAMGVVYAARHVALDKPFAVKLLDAAVADVVARQRFEREAQALGRLAHPNIVEVTDFGVDDGTPYLVTEYLEGETLADRLGRSGPLPLGVALPILDAVSSAVDHAHDRGILHRDIKPSNVFLCAQNGEPPRVKVLDFGLAQLLEPVAVRAPPGSDSQSSSAGQEDLPSRTRITQRGSLVGTPSYMAPESIRDGTASPSSDIYAFGVLVYETLVGRPVFEGSVASVLDGHMNTDPAPSARSPSALSPEVWSALAPALAKQPALRPGRAGEIVHALYAATRRAEAARWHRRERPRRIGAAALLALSACALSVGFMRTPAGSALERWSADLRFRMAPRRSPDARLLLLTLDEASVSPGARSIAQRAEEFGVILETSLTAGARGIALDILLPAQWGESNAFANLLLKHPNSIVVAAMSSPTGVVVGPECIPPVVTAALGNDGTAALFGFVNLDRDSDGVVRTARVGYRDRSGVDRLSWAARAALLLGSDAPAVTARPSFRIDTRVDAGRLEKLSWGSLKEALRRKPELLRGRLLLVGGEAVGYGDDYHYVAGGTPVSGLVLQALVVDTLLAGRPVREARRFAVLVAAAAVATLTAAMILLGSHIRLPVTLAVAPCVLYLAAGTAWFLHHGLLLPIVAPELLVTLAVAGALGLRRLLPPVPPR